MMCNSMTACGLRCTGRRSLQRFSAAPGSTKGIQIAALHLTLRSLVTSWRFVSLLQSIRNILVNKLWILKLHRFLRSNTSIFTKFCIKSNVQFTHRQNIRKLYLPTSGTVDWSSHQEKPLSCTIQR